jgi:choline dehydrogenase-like flavoprotein
MIASDLAAPQGPYDVCVIGSGPAGLAVALECENRGLSVAVLEAGAKAMRRDPQTDFTATILEPRSHVPLHVGARQCFGGTSASWGGLCVALDGIDLERRDHVAHSGWPIGLDEIKAWEAPAAHFLGCGEPEFRTTLPGWGQSGDPGAATVGRLARKWNLGRAYRHRIARSEKVHVFLDRRVIGLDIDPGSGVVTGLSMTGRAGRHPGPQARSYVIAGGGLQSTALLLDIQRRQPGFFGGERGPLGRFYMGHVTGEIATIILNRAEDARDMLFQFDRYGTPTQRRLRIDDARQASARLLNTAFTLRSPPLMNSVHGNGALSIAYLASRVPAVRNLFASQRFRGVQAQATPAAEGDLVGHLANVFRLPYATALDSARLVSQARVDKLPVILLNRGGCYSLRYHAEQAPNPDSRVWLGAPRPSQQGHELAIDFRYQDEDSNSVIRAHEALDRMLQASGKGRLEYWHGPEERLAAVRTQARDGYHQIGTTRMGETPGTSVVDRDCRVHGVRNLFVASSSVFPTSSAANPTFPIICLSLRLANHLARVLAPAWQDVVTSAPGDDARLGMARSTSQSAISDEPSHHSL